jgi:hypothetical protein
MRRQPPSDDAKAAERRRRRAGDMRALRSRCRRHVRLFKIEIGDREVALAIKFVKLEADHTENKEVVARALGRLFSRGFAAVLNEEAARRK